jgi:hypothetical protein
MRILGEFKPSSKCNQEKERPQRHYVVSSKLAKCEIRAQKKMAIQWSENQRVRSRLQSKQRKHFGLSTTDAALRVYQRVPNGPF